MKLTDLEIKRHLIQGGHIGLDYINWVYAKLDEGKLCWFESGTGKFNSPVGSFTELVSNGWHIIDTSQYVSVKNSC